MTTFDKFRNCITEPRCRDCEGIPGVCEVDHQSVSIPKALALDVLELLKEYENIKERHEILVNHADTMLAMLKEQEAVTPYIDIDEAKCPICKVKLTRQELLGDDVLFEDFFDYCPHCGRAVKWNERSNGNNTQTN